jgi:hypothetical protein
MYRAANHQIWRSTKVFGKLAKVLNKDIIWIRLVTDMINKTF